MSLIRLAKMSAFGQNVRPSDGALLYIYEVGTTTPKTTYSDVEETIPHTHPVEADAAGVFPPVYLSGFYKEVLKDKNNVQISSVDGLQVRAGDVRYLGDFDSSTNAGDYPAEGNTGDQYRVTTGFKLNTSSGSHLLKTGDFIQANKNGATAVDADWDIIQGVDHQVTGTVPISDGVNIATNCKLGTVFTVTIAGNRTLDNPTNMRVGETYTWVITQDGTGGRTLAFGGNFKPSVAPSIRTSANALTVIQGVIVGESIIRWTILGSPNTSVIWRMVNNESAGNQTPLGGGGSDWELSDDVQNEFYVGSATQITESSGIFSFATTGHWSVKAYGFGTIAALNLVLQSTIDDSAYIQICIAGAVPGASDAATASLEVLLRIDSISLQKIRLGQIASTGLFAGVGTYNATYIVFTKLSEL